MFARALTQRPGRTGHLALALICAAFVAGCGGGGDQSTNSTFSKNTPPAGATGASGETGASTTATTDQGSNPSSQNGAGEAPASASGEATPAPTEDLDNASHVDVYFTAGEQFHAVKRSVPRSANPLEYATKALLAGPRPVEMKSKVPIDSVIPAGTKVDDIELGDDGVAHVALSKHFLEGIPAQKAQRSDEQEGALDARLGQITYTLTSFKQVKSTDVSSGGIALTSGQKRGNYEKPSGPPPKVTHKQGSKVPGTRAVQRRLWKLKYLPKAAIDGAAGYRTQEAVIAFQAWNGLTRDGVVGPQTTAALKKAHAPRPHKGGPSRRVEIYRDKGVALVIRRGKLKRAVHVSSGGPGHTTPSGSYKVFRKEVNSWSVPFHTWLPYASYFNNGIALHEYPDVPAYPASHGCVRVPTPEAKFIYGFARIGTPVVVY